ncbi:uromodulin-like [Pleurodeles waltl]
MMIWIGLGLALSLCLLPTASAQNICSSDEIYDEANDTCNCNLTMYNSTGMPPTPSLQCLSGQIKISVSKCQLERSGYDSSNLHLLDPSCVGVRMNESISQIVLIFNTSVSCGTTMMMNDSFLIYTNNVTIPGRIYSNGILARNDVSFNFSCSYHLQRKAALELGIYTFLKPIDTNIGDVVGTMTVEMAAYTDFDFTVAYTESTPFLNIDDPLYISVKYPDLDATALSAKVTHLYATTVNDPYYSQQYHIIFNGCPSVDFKDLMIVKNNGNTTEAQFVLQVFHINGTDTLFLFADVEICTGTCIQVCT